MDRIEELKDLLKTLDEHRHELQKDIMTIKNNEEHIKLIHRYLKDPYKFDCKIILRNKFNANEGEYSIFIPVQLSTELMTAILFEYKT